MVVRPLRCRTTVVRCCTILDDEVVRRRTILDEIVQRRRTTIVHISYDEPLTSHDVVWRRTTSHDLLMISHINENHSKFLNMTKNSRDIVILTPDNCDFVQRRLMVRDHPKITHRRWSYDVLMAGVTTSYNI